MTALALFGPWPPPPGASSCRIPASRTVDLKNQRATRPLSLEELEERLQYMASRGASLAWDDAWGAFLAAWPDGDPHAWRDQDVLRVHFSDLLERYGLKAPKGGLRLDIPLASLTLVFCDVETTGTNTTKHRLCELALCRVEPYAEPVWESGLLDPEQPITNTQYHGITDADVRGMPLFADVAERALELLDGAVFISHQTSGIDRRFLAMELEAAGMPWAPAAELNTCRMAKKLFPELGSHTLQDLAQVLSIPVVRKHRAKDDVQTMMALYEKLLTRAAARTPPPKTLADYQRL